MDDYMLQDDVLAGLGLDFDMPLGWDWQDSAAISEVIGILQQEITSAQSEMMLHVDKIKKWRRNYALIPNPDRVPPFVGAANYVTPLTRSKVDGVAAYLADALQEDPFYTFRARIAELEPICNSLEEYFDQRIDNLETNVCIGLRDFAQHVTRESLIAGAAIVRVTWEEIRTEQGPVRARNRADIVPIDDFLVSPVNVTRLEDAYMVAHKFWLPYWRLQQLAEDGMIQQVADIRGHQSFDGPNTVNNEQHGHGGFSGTPDSMQVELFECWCQWRGSMWRFWYYAPGSRLLLAEPNPYQHGRAPFAVIRHDPQPNYLFGASLAEILAPTQQENDTVTNMRIDANAFGAAPMTVVRPGSDMSDWFRNNPPEPGAVIDGNPNDFAQIQISPAHPVTLQDQQLLGNYADKATIPDIALAQPLTNRDPTATEVRRDQGFVAVKTSAWLHGLHNGLRELGYLLLYNLHQFEVSPSQSMDTMEIPGIGSVQVPTSGVFEFLTGADTHVIKASTMFLEGVELSVNGSQTQTARAERSGLATMLMQQVLPLIAQGLHEKPQVWAMLKMLLDANNVKNWREIIGDKPNAQEYAQKEQMKQQMAMMQQQQGGPPPQGPA